MMELIKKRIHMNRRKSSLTTQVTLDDDFNVPDSMDDVEQLIMQSDYNGAMRDAATNANFTAQIQSVKDMIYQNKIEALQAQVGQLQLQAATSNVLRFPNAWTFNGGVFPPAAAAAA